MKFVFKEIREISKLSWCAILENGREEVQLLHGSWVEVKGHFFVEGIWDLKFSDGFIDKSCLLMGSGGRADKSNVIFASPCHTLETLYYIIKDNKCYVSNSIAFVLAQTDLSPDIDYLHYVSDFSTIANGIDKYVKEIPLENGFMLNLAYYQNLVINSDLTVQVEDKQKPTQVDNFVSYKQFLIDCLRLLSKNANDADRSIKYSPLATISRGYDSPACAALAKQIGCNKVLTVAGPGKYIHDCGTDIAKTLGYDHVVEIMFDKYKENAQMIEPLFMASGELGLNLFWASYEEHLPQHYVVIGINGEKVWDINNSSVSTTIKRGAPCATSLGEYRLQTGFIQVPVPYFGVVHQPAIHRISTSEEMKPWALGTDYDRPIPRRIVEEMGVERNQFGKLKIGIGFWLDYLPLFRMKQKMRGQSFESFRDYFKRRRTERKRTFRYIIQCIKFCLFMTVVYYNFLLDKLGFGSRKISYNTFADSFRENPFASSYLFLWGVHHSKELYRISLSRVIDSK